MKKNTKKKRESAISRKRKKTVIQRAKTRVKTLKRKIERIGKKRTSTLYKKKENSPLLKTPLPTPVGKISADKEKVEVSKFVGLKEPQIIPQEIGEISLPQKYYDNRITLLPRDPWWLHTYWDISETKISEVVSSIPIYEREGLKWILRVYDVTGVKDFRGDNANSFFDIDIHFEAGNWYINVDKPERDWCVEIGFKNPYGKFFPLVRSNITKTPCFGISNVVDEEWILGEEDYYKILGIYDLGKSSLERRKKLEEIIKHQISSGAFSGGISSRFSFMKKEEARKFFLEVWTELIIYGRTHPKATVEVEKKRVNLRSDGTFSLRYALPEGDFEFKIVATSPDKKERIKITHTVKRGTK
ncbi:MAG: hypothetical protein DRP72_01700 [Candidatus Omnitrophota bacterium]|nr:MAG: hypothetical protein DRP72_01700 [Candidatus Omnitrophota bacterium]